jgi:hypothetical protein
MIRRNHLTVTAALVAVCALPASAAAMPEGATSSGPNDAVPPPPSLMAAGAADEYEELRSTGADDTGRSQAPAYPSPYSLDATRDTESPVLARTYGSPDALDAARQVPPSDGKPPVLARTYGSPDALDAARELPPVQVSTPVLRVDEPSGGFDWGDAGIGAAGMLGLFGIAAGSALLIAGRRRGRFGVATH